MKHKDNTNSYITGFILLSVLLIFGIPNAHAISMGITGYSGNPDHTNGANCTTCHAGGSVPVLVFSGPAAVLVGTTNSYSITLSGGQESVAGFDLSASHGELIDTNASGTTTQTSGEITHAQSIIVGTTAKTWTFDWVAPGVPANVTFYVSALSGDGDGSSMGDNTVSETYAVTVTIDNSRVPTAEVGGPYIGAAGVAVQFNAGASFDLDGNIVRYLWDFGDNTAFVEGATPTHSYTDVGEYTVTLAVTDNDGLTGAAADTVTIGAGLPPVANAGGPYAGNVGTAIQFDASASNDPDGNIVAYNWDFGDGNSGTGVNPTHSYATEGSFDVVLTITDNDNWMVSSTTTATISVVGTSTGEQLYNQNCAGCHGPGGTGGFAIPVTNKTANDIATAIANDIGTMGSITLIFADIQLIADYLAVGGTTPPPTTGEGLYDVYCAFCHGAGGAGATAIPVIGATVTLITRGINTVASMSSINLSLENIQLISDYLNSGAVARPTDGPGLYAAYCESCHGVDGEGGPDGSVTGKSESDINSYIDSEPDMQSLGSLLTSQEIGLIADFLNGN